MVIGLFSGGIDKLTAAGVILSGAAADDMDVEVYVLLQAARAFKKEVGVNNDSMAEVPHLKDQFLDALKATNSPNWVEFFEQAREFTDVKIYVCSLAGKIWGGEKKEDFIDLVDDFCGIGEYVTAAQEADVHMFI